MSDQAEYGRIMREHRQKKHRDWYAKNMSVLGQSDVPFVDKGETLLFRLPCKPKVDFYPSTGRWRVVGDRKQQKAMSGGAKKFLEWYGQQSKYGATTMSGTEKMPVGLVDGIISTFERKLVELREISKKLDEIAHVYRATRIALDRREEEVEALKKSLSDVLGIIDSQEAAAEMTVAWMHGFRVDPEVSRQNGAVIDAAYGLLGQSRPKEDG